MPALHHIAQHATSIIYMPDVALRSTPLVVNSCHLLTVTIEYPDLYLVTPLLYHASPYTPHTLIPTGASDWRSIPLRV